MDIERSIARYVGRTIKSDSIERGKGQTKKRSISRVRSKTKNIKQKQNKRTRKSQNLSRTKSPKPEPQPEIESEIICKRRKRSGPLINTVDLLSRAAKSYTSNIPPLKEDELRRRVNSIEPGLHYVTLSVFPKTHTIFVNITDKTIFIADWNGDIRSVGLKIIDGKKNPDYSGEAWEQYSQFIQLLQEKYDKSVEYYEVDKELLKIAEKKAEAGGGGGCAEYVYEWVAKHKDSLS